MDAIIIQQGAPAVKRIGDDDEFHARCSLLPLVEYHLVESRTRRDSRPAPVVLDLRLHREGVAALAGSNCGGAPGRRRSSYRRGQSPRWHHRGPSVQRLW
jgi:hypothetical protein